MNIDKILYQVNKYSAEEKYAEAIEFLLTEIEHHDKSASLYSELGNLYVTCGRKEKALTAHNRAVEISPDSEAAWHLKGIAHFFFRETDEAVRAIEKSASLDPDNGETHKNLAVGYFYQKRFEDALTHLQLARSLGFTVTDEQISEFEAYYFGSMKKKQID